MMIERWHFWLIGGGVAIMMIACGFLVSAAIGGRQLADRQTLPASASPVNFPARAVSGLPTISPTSVMTALTIPAHSSAPKTAHPSPSAAPSPTPDRPAAIASPAGSLPELSLFQTQKTDQFLVDFQFIASGHPFKGKNAPNPHAGAHINFDNSTARWPAGLTPNQYPPVYAVADGIIDMVQDSVNLGDKDRYGISLALATDHGINVDLDYSLEPFIKEPSAGFYKQFILVKQGERVKKGQLIGYMYLPVINNGLHIHFHLRENNRDGFMAPAIFNDSVIQSFKDHWADFGVDAGQTIPNCMGWKLAAEENPFASGAIECLK